MPTLIDAARLMCFAGLNITYPCKQLVIPLLDAVSDEAEAIGAVNTVVRPATVSSDTTPTAPAGAGASGAHCRGRTSRAWSCSAPAGAGSACADAVLRLGARGSSIVDQDAPRAAALAARLECALRRRARERQHRPAARHCRRASGLIHATPTGMAAMPGLPLHEDWLRPAMWVSEVVYVPWRRRC